MVLKVKKLKKAGFFNGPTLEEDGVSHNYPPVTVVKEASLTINKYEYTYTMKIDNSFVFKEDGNYYKFNKNALFFLIKTIIENLRYLVIHILKNYNRRNFYDSLRDEDIEDLEDNLKYFRNNDIEDLLTNLRNLENKNIIPENVYELYKKLSGFYFFKFKQFYIDLEKKLQIFLARLDREKQLLLLIKSINTNIINILIFFNHFIHINPEMYGKYQTIPLDSDLFSAYSPILKIAIYDNKMNKINIQGRSISLSSSSSQSKSSRAKKTKTSK
jgi:hypothetical protein